MSDHIVNDNNFPQTNEKDMVFKCERCNRSEVPYIEMFLGEDFDSCVDCSEKTECDGCYAWKDEDDLDGGECRECRTGKSKYSMDTPRQLSMER